MSKSYYFFVFYPRKEKEKENDIEFVKPEEKDQQPECIFSLEEIENGIFYYKKIFKVSPKEAKGKKSTSCYYEFEIGEEIYIISFKRNNTFVFDVEVKFGKSALDIRRNIPQTNISYIDKLDYFIESLKENTEEDKTDELFKDALALYFDKKLFSFLIPLFIKVYKKKELCSELIYKFKEMNCDPKLSEKNMDRKDYLKDYTSKFIEIISEADQLVNDNNYNSIAFYGVLLCYLNFYDSKNFSSLVNKLLSKKKSEDLYEILLIYNKHLINPIKQNFEFLKEFIRYIIKNKNFDTFKIGLKYIKYIEDFIAIIVEKKNREDILNAYIKGETDPKKKEKHYIELGRNLKLKKTEKFGEDEDENNIEDEKKKKEEEETIPTNTLIITPSETSELEKNKRDYKKETSKHFKDNSHINIEKKEKKIALELTKNIEEIISFCNKNNVFLIYLTNDFWKYILYYYQEPTQNNIIICFNIRKAFINYYKLVTKIFEKKKNSIIKKDALTCFDNDEFAYLLDDIIKSFMNSHKDLKNIEKLGYITKYNPYYKEEKFHEKVDSDIFDSFDLNQIDEETIADFRNFKFENVFKGKINDFTREFISKIKNISNFEAVIKLINFKRIIKNEPKSMKKFLEFLNKKYDDIIPKEIESVTDIDKAIKIVADLGILFFTYEEEEHKLDFETEKIKKLSKNIYLLFSLK